MNDNSIVRGGDAATALNPALGFDGGVAQPKQPNKFLSVLRGVGASVVGMLPGGNMISGLIRGGLSNGPDFGSMQQVFNDSARSQAKMLMMQQQVSTQGQEFTAVSNLLKARHDSEMSAVNNFKS